MKYEKIIFSLVIIVFLSCCFQERIEYISEVYFVERIIDGDTFVLTDGKHVRLIGINTPEKNEHYYDESTNKLSELILNKELTLEKDVNDKDWYNRSLRYVYVDDVFINLLLVEQGYARAYDIKPNIGRSQMFIEAEIRAKESSLGMWNS